MTCFDKSIRGVLAINANKVSVTFSKPVDDTKAVFSVKRGSVSEDVVVTWNDAKTVATLTKTGNFIAGDYTVAVTGLEGLENASNTLKIEAEVVKSVEIANGQLQKSATAPLTVNFLNQYGEETTVPASSSVTVTAFNTTDSTRTVTQPSVSKYELNSSATNVGDKVQVTVIYKGLTATKTLDVVSAAAVNEVLLGEAVLPTGKDKFTQAGTKDVELKYTSTNTLGETYKLKASDLTGVNPAVKLYTSDDAILSLSDVKVDTDGKIKIDKFGTKTGEVTLTAISTATGKSSSVTINVQQNEGAPSEVALEKSTTTFAAGKSIPQYVAITVKDNYGTVIPTKDLKASDYSITSDNTSVVAATANLVTVGENAGKIEITPNAGATKGQSATITVLVKATGQKATITATASDAVEPTTIDVKKDTTVPTSLLVGAISDLKFDVKDQYDTPITAGNGFTVDFTTSDDTVIGLTSKGLTLADPKVTATAKKAGSATIKAQLKKDNVVVAEKTFTINVVANNSANLNYTIDAVAPVYKGLLSEDLVGETLGTATIASVATTADKERAIKSGYAEEVTLYATDANGVKNIVPASALVGGAPTITQAKKADASGNTTGQLSVFELNNKFYVYTSTAFASSDFTVTNAGVATTQDVKAKATFTVNAEDNIKVVSQDITISKADLQAKSVEFKSALPGTKNAVDVTGITVTDYAAYNNTVLPKDAFLWVQDQFGGYSLADTGAEATSFLSVVALKDANLGTADTVTIGGAAAAQNGKLTITDTGSDAKFTANNAVVRVVAKSTSGELIDFINVTVEKENVAPTATLTAATSTTNNPTTLVATFNEALYNGATAIANGADVKAQFAYDGTAGNYTSATYNATDKTVTFVFTAAEDGKKLTAAATLKDANGNVSKDVYTYTTAGTLFTKTVTP